MNTFFDFVSIEADGGDGIFFKGSISDGFDKGGFAGILQADDGNLELFVEKFGFYPVHKLPKPGKHCYLFDLYFIGKEII